MNLPKYSNCVGDWRFFLGSFRDYSGNNNDGMPVGVYFTKRPDTHVLASKLDDIINLGNRPSLVSSQGTIIMYGDDLGDPFHLYGRLLWSNNLDLAFQTTTVVSLNGTSASFVWKGAKSMTMVFEDGFATDFYRDGIFSDSTSSATTINTASTSTYLLNRGSTTNTWTGAPIKGFLWWNTKLSAEEIAQVHEWIMNTKSVSLPKKRFVYPSLITGKEKGALFAPDLKQYNGKIADKVSGTLGTVTDCSPSRTSSGMPSLKFQNTASNVNFGNIADLGTNDFTMRALVKIRTNLTSTSSLLNKTLNASNRWIWYLTADEKMGFFGRTSLSLSVNSVDSATIPIGKWVHLLITGDRSGNLSYYVNSVLGDSDAFSDANTLDNTGDLKIGADSAVPIGVGDIEVAEVETFNYALTDEEIQADYKKYAKLPYYVDDLADANESIVDEGGTIGEHLSNTEFKFGSTAARYRISRDSTKTRIIGDDLITDGDMEASGTTAWTNIGTGSIAKITSDPHGGTQSLKSTNNATVPAGNIFKTNDSLIVGKRYHITGWVKGVNTVPRLYNSGVGYFWIGVGDGTWERIDATVTATAADLFFYNVGTTVSAYTNWDDVTIYEVDCDKKVIQCKTAGYLYRDIQQAFGTWELDFYKHSAATISHISIVSEQADSVGVGYKIRFNQYRQVELFRAGVLLMKSAPNYITPQTWYKIRVTRNYAGKWYFYIKGGDFTDWTLLDVTGGSGSNPATDDTYDYCKFTTLFLNPYDEITNFHFTEGVMAP